MLTFGKLITTSTYFKNFIENELLCRVATLSLTFKLFMNEKRYQSGVIKSNFWSMFPFHTPENNRKTLILFSAVFKGYKIGRLAKPFTHLFQCTLPLPPEDIRKP